MLYRHHKYINLGNMKIMENESMIEDNTTPSESFIINNILDLSNLSLSDSRVKRLSLVIEANYTSIIAIIMKNTHNNSNTNIFSIFQKTFPSLKDFSIIGLKQANESLNESLLEVIMLKNKQLEKITMDNIFFTKPNSINSIFENIQQLSNLKELKLNSIRLTSSLISMIPNNLNCLECSNAQMEVNDLTMLFEILRNSFSNLRVFNLSNNNLSYISLNEILSISSLEKIIMKNCEISNSSITTLSKSIENSRKENKLNLNIKEIELDNNYLNDSCLSHIPNILQDLPSLNTISLLNNEILASDVEGVFLENKLKNKIII